MNKNRENRLARVEVRFSESEKKHLSDKADQLGMNISTYIRQAVLKDHIISKTDLQTAFELKKIGTNLNQLAKHVNSLPVNENILNSLNNIDNYINELKQITDKLI